MIFSTINIFNENKKDTVSGVFFRLGYSNNLGRLNLHCGGLADGAQAASTHADAVDLLDVRLEHAGRLVLRLRDVAAGNRSLAADLTLGHENFLTSYENVCMVGSV